jgi:mannan endo-1,4-beta-mannosidase
MSWAAAGRLASCLLGAVALAATMSGCGLLSAPQPTAVVANPIIDRPATVSGRPVVPIASLIHPAGKFLGVEVPGAPDSLNPVISVAAGIGRNPNLIGQYVQWNAPFDAAAAARSVSYGALYYAAWEPFDTSVQSIAQGTSDAYITSFAKAVRAFGDPIALSFGHEMNGDWYPWGTKQTTAASFVAAWRHIHDLFAKAGADNVIWIWNPNIISPMPNVQLKPYWPGSAYVDWVGITGYFATTGPHTFDGLYGQTMAEIRQFTTKPFIIAETAVETGPSDEVSVLNLVSGVQQRSDVLGFIWFNYDKNGVDWTVDGRPAVRAAIAGSVAGMKLVSLAQPK